MSGGALRAGQTEVTCPLHGVIAPDTLTKVEIGGDPRILHRPCGLGITVYRGPDTGIVVHAHDCGHAVLVPYRAGEPMPSSPGCFQSHGRLL